MAEKEKTKDYGSALTDLRNVLEARTESFFRKCEELGTNALIFCKERSFFTQAGYYRASRTTTEIHAKADSLRERDFPELADALLQRGPVYGKIGDHRTYAAPGESWHNYGLAFDAVPVLLSSGRLCWDVEKYADEWKLFDAAAEDCGLCRPYTDQGDFVHFQLKYETPFSSPLSAGIVVDYLKSLQAVDFTA